MKAVHLFVALILTLPVLAQNNTNSTEPAYIEVTGKAEKEIIPDEIYIAITLKERQEGKDKMTIEQQEQALKEALLSIKVPLENLELSDANADYVKVKWQKKDVIARTEYLLKVGNAQTVGKVFEQLDRLKIQDAYIAKVSHSKLEEYQKEVKVMAIKAAKEKADYLLEAIGEETGKPLIVREDSRHAIYHANYKAESLGYQDDGYALENEAMAYVIEFRKIKLTAQMYVKFSIQ